MSNQSLKNKVALVTGGGRGIGRSIAIAFAKEGADVIVASRSKDQIDTVAQEITDLGQKSLAIPTDVTDRLEVDSMAEKVREEFGRLDILVNNAGGGIEKNLVLESDPELWIKDVTVNCISAYIVSHSLLPLMVESGGGKVINVGSGMGHQATSRGSAYHVGKAGIWMFTQCLAEEVWEHNITVNELVPGPVATDLTRGRMTVGGPPPFAPSEYIKGPDDVAPLALFMATQPDGGPTAQCFSLARRPL